MPVKRNRNLDDDEQVKEPLSSLFAAISAAPDTAAYVSWLRDHLHHLPNKKSLELVKAQSPDSLVADFERFLAFSKEPCRFTSPSSATTTTSTTAGGETGGETGVAPSPVLKMLLDCLPGVFRHDDEHDIKRLAGLLCQMLKLKTDNKHQPIPPKEPEEEEEGEKFKTAYALVQLRIGPLTKVMFKRVFGWEPKLLLRCKKDGPTLILLDPSPRLIEKYHEDVVLNIISDPNVPEKKEEKDGKVMFFVKKEFLEDKFQSHFTAKGYLNCENIKAVKDVLQQGKGWSQWASKGKKQLPADVSECLLQLEKTPGARGGLVKELKKATGSPRFQETIDHFKQHGELDATGNKAQVSAGLSGQQTEVKVKDEPSRYSAAAPPPPLPRHNNSCHGSCKEAKDLDEMKRLNMGLLLQNDHLTAENEELTAKKKKLAAENEKLKKMHVYKIWRELPHRFSEMLKPQDSVYKTRGRLLFYPNPHAVRLIEKNLEAWECQATLSLQPVGKFSEILATFQQEPTGEVQATAPHPLDLFQLAVCRLADGNKYVVGAVAPLHLKFCQTLEALDEYRRVQEDYQQHFKGVLPSSFSAIVVQYGGRTGKKRETLGSFKGVDRAKVSIEAAEHYDSKVRVDLPEATNAKSRVEVVFDLDTLMVTVNGFSQKPSFFFA